MRRRCSHTRGTLAAPSARDGGKHLRLLLYHSGLLLRREQQNPETVLFQRQGGEDLSVHPEIGVAEVSALTASGMERAMRRKSVPVMPSPPRGTGPLACRCLHYYAVFQWRSVQEVQF